MVTGQSPVRGAQWHLKADLYLQNTTCSPSFSLPAMMLTSKRKEACAWKEAEGGLGREEAQPLSARPPPAPPRHCGWRFSNSPFTYSTTRRAAKQRCKVELLGGEVRRKWTNSSLQYSLMCIPTALASSIFVGLTSPCQPHLPAPLSPELDPPPTVLGRTVVHASLDNGSMLTQLPPAPVPPAPVPPAPSPGGPTASTSHITDRTGSAAASADLAIPCIVCADSANTNQHLHLHRRPYLESIPLSWYIAHHAKNVLLKMPSLNASNVTTEGSTTSHNIIVSMDPRN
jgi:hypothetical protein